MMKCMCGNFFNDSCFYLKEAYDKKELRIPKDQGYLKNPSFFSDFIDGLYRKIWIVYSKPSFKGVEHVFDYLGRYTHRVAISNDRIKEVKDGKVSFTIKDRKTDKIQLETISAQTFIKRFLLHELPLGFMRIRYFGFLGNRNRKLHVEQIRNLLGSVTKVASLNPIKPDKNKGSELQDLMMRMTGLDIGVCPACKKGRIKKLFECYQFDKILLNLTQTINKPIKAISNTG